MVECFTSVMQEVVCNTSAIFGLRVFEDVICFEQVSVFFFKKFARNTSWIVFLFAICTPLANLIGNYVCMCRFDKNYFAFAHLMCDWKKERTFFFGGQSMKDNFW
jgi:hypothetical protein